MFLHNRLVTGRLAGRTCDMILGQTITALDTVNSGQDPPKLGMNEMIARKKVFGEKGVNPSRQAREVLQKRRRGIEEKG